jgi:hypothetical protein
VPDARRTLIAITASALLGVAALALLAGHRAEPMQRPADVLDDCGARRGLVQGTNVGPWLPPADRRVASRSGRACPELPPPGDAAPGGR